MTISLRRVDGREQRFRIVGEYEADPSRGTVSYVSPLARAVLTHGPGADGGNARRRSRHTGRTVGVRRERLSAASRII